MTDRIPARAIEGLTTAALGDFDAATPPSQGDIPAWDESIGKYVPTPAAAATAGGGELLMQDGVTAPPVPLETEGRDDWLYLG